MECLKIAVMNSGWLVFSYKIRQKLAQVNKVVSLCKKLWKYRWNLEDLFSTDLERLHSSKFYFSVHAKNFPHLQQLVYILKIFSDENDAMILWFWILSYGCPRVNYISVMPKGSAGGALWACQPTIMQTYSIVARGVGVFYAKSEDNCLIHLFAIYH